MNRTITIRNVGPIEKEVTITLNRVNILIGQQGIGKSTIAKIACYCSWVEKEISTMQTPESFEEDGYFIENLVIFHQLTGFINENTFISFSSDALSFKYENGKFSFRWNENRWGYKRRKTLYIPAERNIVAVIPNWFEVKLANNNTRSYLADWERVRRHHTSESPVPMVGATQYYFNQTNRSDHIITADGKDILLQNASSGLQTLAPLQALIKYYADDFYQKTLYREENGIDDNERYAKLGTVLMNHLYETELTKEERVAHNMRNQQIFKTHEDITTLPYEVRNRMIFPNQKFQDRYNSIVKDMWIASSTAFFIEEPELNLYPTSQYELIRSLIELLKSTRRPHTVFITTHSPYILTTLNNLIFGAEVAKQHPKEVSRVLPESLWVNKEDVAAWKLTNMGVLEDLMSTEIPMLKAEEIDDISGTINDEFDELFEIEQTSGL
ncbi:MAG TPA: ATP-binding protein [Bacteroidales bacterium]|jgi:energy-coupling factor transporter ATP-binding protein EcfA2|nr:AAA family ATPase [Bacteroidota bacterium]HHU27049.1 ATP-binding protein [Bacteroidales bacterium]